LISDDRPHLDDCVYTSPGLANANQVTMSGKNMGDLLNAKGITWGWFRSGPSGLRTTPHGLAGDDAVTQSSNGDYIPHHEPFQY
jgi:phospholipase C